MRFLFFPAMIFSGVFGLGCGPTAGLESELAAYTVETEQTPSNICFTNSCKSAQVTTRICPAGDCNVRFQGAGEIKTWLDGTSCFGGLDMSKKYDLWTSLPPYGSWMACKDISPGKGVSISELGTGCQCNVW